MLGSSLMRRGVSSLKGRVSSGLRSSQAAWMSSSASSKAPVAFNMNALGNIKMFKAAAAPDAALKERLSKFLTSKQVTVQVCALGPFFCLFVLRTLYVCVHGR
jgi:hypothetical protein